MQNYVNQLLGDLNQQVKRSPSIAEIDSTDDLLELSKLYSRPKYSIANLLEIEQGALPPPEKLNDQQISLLMESIENALTVHQCYLDFPKGIIDRKRYTILRSYWNEPQLICSKSVNTIDFCDYDQDNCVYGREGCECIQLEKLG